MNQNQLDLEHLSQRWKCFQAIDQLLSTGNAISIRNLENACGLEERRVKEYISELKAEPYNAPIEYDAKQRGHRYTKPFKLDVVLKLAPKEIEILEFAVNTLKQFQSLQMLADIAPAIDKVENMVKSKVSALPTYIELETMPKYQGAEYIHTFLEAIKAKQQVSFCYQKIGKNTSIETYKLCPYLIKEHKNRYYVIGKVEGKGYRVFGLDRIVSPEKMKILPDIFLEDKNFNLPDLLRYSYGLFISDTVEPEEVTLSFTPERGKYLKSLPLQAYQKPYNVIDNETEYQISYKLKINDELVQDIVRWGAEVKVIAPESLRHKVREHYRRALEAD